MAKKNPNLYGVYDPNYYDLPMAIGSAKELAKFLNITVDSFYTIYTRQKKGTLNTQKYKIKAIKN